MSNFEDVKTFMKTFGQEIKIKSKLTIVQKDFPHFPQGFMEIFRKFFCIK